MLFLGWEHSNKNEYLLSSFRKFYYNSAYNLENTRFLRYNGRFIVEVDYSGTTVTCHVMVSLVPQPSFHPRNVNIELTKPG